MEVLVPAERKALFLCIEDVRNYLVLSLTNISNSKLSLSSFIFTNFFRTVRVTIVSSVGKFLFILLTLYYSAHSYPFSKTHLGA